MIWWDWKTTQRLAVLAVMIALAATALLLAGGVAIGWNALIGGVSFLFIPQLLAWLLFVGLKTGRMPSAHGRFEQRAERPTWFWLTGSLYVVLLLLFLSAIGAVTAGGILGS